MAESSAKKSMPDSLKGCIRPADAPITVQDIISATNTVQRGINFHI
jgi:hypothetical protein